MSLLLAFLGETKNGVSVSQQQSSSDDLTWQDHRHDICHKHHKQCLCKIVSTPDKFFYRENFISVISKTFVLLWVELVF